MSQLDPKIKDLEDRLDRLVRTQIGFQSEITYIRGEISRLREQTTTGTTKLDDQPKVREAQPGGELPPKWSTGPGSEPPRHSAAYEAPKAERPPSFGHSYESITKETRSGVREERFSFGIEDKISGYFSKYVENARANLEKFIGENLISKIGIIILILGVGIGAKYAIDNNLISPLARIIFGYIFGIGLLGLAVKFKSKYHDFSAVLLSGGMAIMYFITYFAYSSYQLMPQVTAFTLMVMFTIFTVATSIVYDRQVIAHIGLVGAYAVPFLLSNNSGNYAFLFSYMSILNAGVLAISIKRAWKPVFYTASVITWIIFAGWVITKFDAARHLHLALITLAVFFSIFYVTKIIHGVVHLDTDSNEKFVSTIITCVVFYLFVTGVGDAVTGTADRILFFSYVACISLAILVSFNRFYGRVIVYVCYPFTWLIFASWFYNHYRSNDHFVIAAIFASIYFLIFYGTTLYYRLVKADIGMNESIGLFLSNSLVFYGFGYGILDSRENLRQYEGLYTAAHGVLHLLTAYLVNRFKTDAIDVIQTLAVLIITFATVAIPVQFDGNHVALIWSVEAVVLFYFGRKRGVWLFECLSYPIMMLAAVSVAFVWLTVYNDRIGTGIVTRNPFFNGDFVSGVIFTASFATIYFINRGETEKTALDKGQIQPFGYVAGTVCLIGLYNVFRMEIGNYFFVIESLRGTAFDIRNADPRRFNFIAQLNYTMLFLTVMAVVNLRKVRSVLTGGVNVALSLLTLVIALTVGMFMLYQLRVSYVKGVPLGLFGIEQMNVVARFITYAFIACILSTLYEYSRAELLDQVSTQKWRSLAFEAVLYPAALIMLSCELVNIAAHLRIADADKFGLSILWGIFALAVIIIGIAKARKHLRFGAFGLLGFTLLKLFFYDATDLPTIPKTILFVSLGLLMLGISFLYNKFRNVIFASVGNDGEIEK